MSDDKPLVAAEDKKNIVQAARELGNPAGGFSLRPRNFDEAYRFANLIASSDLVPKEFRDKPANVLVAVQLGMELGVSPMQALQNIAVINGKPTVYGDLLPALIYNSGLLESLEEEGDEKIARCTAKRKGFPPITRTFSMEDAKKIPYTQWENNQKKVMTLAEKDTYKAYPKRMLQMRARAYALRDQFPDVLKGLAIREEADDFAGATDVTPKPRPQMPQPTATTKGESLETGNDRAAADVGNDQPRMVENPSTKPEGEPSAGEVNSEKGGQGGRPAKEGTTQTLPPSYQERRAWIETASLEELQHNKNFALANMKNLTQAEQASICTMINDKKQALLKAQE